jgi:Flp pilus assembly pilin Flp
VLYHAGVVAVVVVTRGSVGTQWAAVVMVVVVVVASHHAVHGGVDGRWVQLGMASCPDTTL